MMDMDQAVEQMAFGRTMPKMSSCVGFYVSPEVIFVSETRLSGGKPVVEHLLKVPIPASPSGRETSVGGTLNTEFLSNPERLANILKPVLAQVKWGSPFAMASLSHHFGLLRYFSMPPIERRFWKTAVPAESKKFIPIQFTDLVHDFQVQLLPPGPDKRPRQAALFGVTHRKSIEGLSALLQRLGFQLVGVELSPIAVERLWDRLQGPGLPPPYGQVHFDGGRVRILLSENGLPIFFREVVLGPQASLHDLRKVDLSGCVEFTKKSLGAQRPAQVRVSGNLPDIASWRDALAAEVGLPAQVQDTAKALGLKSGEWGGYAAIGTALRHLGSTPLTLDLSHHRRVTDEERNAVYAIFSLVGLALAVLLVVGGLRHATLAMRAQELGRLQGGVHEAFRNKNAEEIQRMMQEMEQRTNTFYSMVGPQVRLTHILEDIAEDVPDNLWLNNVSYMAPFGEILTEGQPRRILKFQGNVKGRTTADEQDIAIQFRENLWKDERFGKVFNCTGPSVNVNPVAAPAEGQQDPDKLSEELEKRTSFSLDCDAKRGT